MITSRKNYYLYLSCVFFFLFAIFTVLVVNGVFIEVDRYMNTHIPYSSTNIFYPVSLIMADLFLPLFVIISILFAYFIKQKRKEDILLLFTSFSGFLASEVILKPIFRIPCPQTYYSGRILEVSNILHFFGLKETCYPSGHTASYVVFSGCFAYFAYRYIKRVWLRRTLYIICGVIIILVGPSRLYLHVHWLSDVIAAYLLGFGLLSLIAYYFSENFS